MRNLLRRPQGKIPEANLDRPAENLTAVTSADFDLATTLTSGQVFRWRPDTATRGGVPSFIGWIDSEFTRVFQRDSQLFVSGKRPEAIRNFFSLEVDLESVARQIGVDPIIHRALSSYWGLRVIRQEKWECLASFILSAFNNIPRLTGMLDRLALHLGEPGEAPIGSGDSQDACRPQRGRLRSASALARPPKNFGGHRARSGLRSLLTPHPSGASPLHHSFPRPEVIAEASERVLRNLGLGFRAPYLKRAAQAVTSGKADLEKWQTLEDEALRRVLLGIPGVGEKVVECVMLFAYGRTSAFPVDVWIGRAMRRWYFRNRKVTDRKIREFARRHFGPLCGWAQQYLYMAARSTRWLTRKVPGVEPTTFRGFGRARRWRQKEEQGSVLNRRSHPAESRNGSEPRWESPDE